MTGRFADLAHGTLSLGVRLGRHYPKTMILGVLVHHAEIAFFLLLLIFGGPRLHAGEGDPFAIRGDMIGADLTLPVSKHLGLAAVDGNAPEVGLAGALRGEVHIASVGRKRRRRGALLATRELHTVGAVRARQ